MNEDLKIIDDKIIQTTKHNVYKYDIVDVIPNNYIIWNIGHENAPYLYIPLCQITSGYNINRDTLKAYKCESLEQWQAIMDAVPIVSQFRNKNFKLACYRFIKRHQDKPNTYGFAKVQKAIPFVDALKFESV